MTVPSGEVTVLMSRPQFAKRVGLNVKTAGKAGTHRSRRLEALRHLKAPTTPAIPETYPVTHKDEVEPVLSDEAVDATLQGGAC